jgi:hypothetical protein
MIMIGFYLTIGASAVVAMSIAKSLWSSHQGRIDRKAQKRLLETSVEVEEFVNSWYGRRRNRESEIEWYLDC